MWFRKKKLQSLCLTKRGQSHINKGLECQDYSLATTRGGKGKDNALICVADGHGAAQHEFSGDGSKIATTVIHSIVEQLWEGKIKNGNTEEFLTGGGLAQRIADDWKKATLEYNKERSRICVVGDDYTILNKYGTTLLFAFILKDDLVVGQVGDGGIALICDRDPRNNQVHPTMEKTSNETASLCMDDCTDYFFIRIYKRSQYNFVLLSTDGVYDTFLDERSYLEFAEEMNSAFKTGVIEMVSELALKELEEVSDDDLSLAMLKQW